MNITPEVSARTVSVMHMCCSFAEACFTLIVNTEEEEVVDGLTARDLHFDLFEKLWIEHIKLPLTEEDTALLMQKIAMAVSEHGLSACGIWELAHTAYHAYTELNPSGEMPTTN